MIKNIIIVLSLFAVIGCSHRPIKTMQYTDDGYVIAARTKQVEVQAKHTAPIRDNAGILSDLWFIRIANNHKGKDWCVGIEWRSMDYSINVPNGWFYLPAGHKLNIGAVIQETWELGSNTFTFDDAAFEVFRLNLIKPTNGRCIINKPPQRYSR